MNYEEGSEPSVQDGEGFSETRLHRGRRCAHPEISGRDLAAEGMFDYGSRVGFWRLMRLFAERSLPMTVFGCALALERNPRPPRRSAPPAMTCAATAGAGSSTTR